MYSEHPEPEWWLDTRTHRHTIFYTRCGWYGWHVRDRITGEIIARHPWPCVTLWQAMLDDFDLWRRSGDVPDVRESWPINMRPEHYEALHAAFEQSPAEQFRR